MDSVLTSDIFFFITACAVIIITGLIAVVLLQAIRLVRTIQSIANRLSENISALEASLRSIPFFGFLFNKEKEKTESVRRRTKRKKKETVVE